MNTKGLVELIVLNIGMDAGVINGRIFAVMVVMALVTTFMTSPIIAWVYPLKYQIEPQEQKKRTISTISENQAIQNILLYLKDNESISLTANIIQMFRMSLPPGGGHLILNGFKAFTDMDRSSAIMVSTQRDHVIENDSTLNTFQFFGKLIGAITKCFVATTHPHEIGMEIDRIAQSEECDLMILPWQQNVVDSDKQAKEVNSILAHANHTTIGIFIDKHLSGATDSIIHGVPYTGIIFIFANTGSLNDMEAFKLAIQLHSHVKGGIQLTIVRLKSGTTKTKMDNELIKAVKRMVKENNNNNEKNIIYHKIKLDDNKSENHSLESIMQKILINSQSSAQNLVIMGHTNENLKITMEKDLNVIENVKENDLEKSSSFAARQLTQRSRKIRDEEQIFGSFGEHFLINLKDHCPSMIIVHAVKKPITVEAGKLFVI